MSWLFFDWACQPFFTLITTFGFAPYFAARLAPNPAEGQAWWGYATAAAGLVLAVLSPLLGSIGDAGGAKKPWIAACGIVLMAGCGTLWFAAPNAAHAVPLALVAFGFATIAAEIAAVFNNALMPLLVPPERIGRLSGAGWATGYAGGVLSLAFVIAFLTLDPATEKSWLGLPPLIYLDPGTAENDRAGGPFTALWFFVFILPFFLFTPDTPKTGRSWREACQEGLIRLRGTLGEARKNPVLARFLIANMIYQDGLVALFAFGGIYGAGVFGWGAIQLATFGILLTVTGALGAWLGGMLDDRLGSERVIRWALMVLIGACLGILSLGRDHVLFVIATRPGAGLFGTVPEQCFLSLGLMVGFVAGPLQSASRSLLARLVPAQDAGRYFGLFALSGKATSFLGPLCIAAATDLTGTQGAGPGVLIGFFIVGLWFLRR